MGFLQYTRHSNQRTGPNKIMLLELVREGDVLRYDGYCSKRGT